MYLTIENIDNRIVYEEQDSEQNLPVTAINNAKICSRSVHSFWETNSWSIDIPGIRFARHNIDVKEEISVKTSEPAPMPGLIFMHRGNISSRFHNNSADHIFSPGHHGILYNPFGTERTVYKKQAGLSMSMVIFKPEHFLQMAGDSCAVMDRFSDGIVTGKTGLTLHNAGGRMTLDMHRILAEISDCPFRGELRTIYLQAKAMELLVLQCTQLEERKVSTGRVLKLSGNDRSKIHAARDIITENIQDPPSLTQLARLVGINDFKLKAGFKIEFSNTVFGYLNNLRLDIAKRDLLQKNKSLTEIAYETGYSSLSHFSNAFKKRYGVSPAYAQRGG
jgi:AraC family transcriptional activator of pyochelin receptor